MFLAVHRRRRRESKDVLKYIISVIIARAHISSSDIELMCHLPPLMSSNKLSNKAVND